MARRTAFTLVEILIVVVILGILASMVVPQFAKATEDSARTATYDQLIKLRHAIDVYYVRNNSTYPTVTAGDGTWGEIVVPGNTYMREKPKNSYITGANGKLIVIRNTPDNAFQTTYGWIFDPATGQVWAAGFDGNDQAFPRP